jgi:hypothetical protein
VEYHIVTKTNWGGKNLTRFFVFLKNITRKWLFWVNLNIILLLAIKGGQTIKGFFFWQVLWRGFHLLLNHSWDVYWWCYIRNLNTKHWLRHILFIWNKMLTFRTFRTIYNHDL